MLGDTSGKNGVLTKPGTPLRRKRGKRRFSSLGSLGLNKKKSVYYRRSIVIMDWGKKRLERKGDFTG